MLNSISYRAGATVVSMPVAGAAFSPFGNLQWVMLNPQPLPPRVASFA